MNKRISRLIGITCCIAFAVNFTGCKQPAQKGKSELTGTKIEKIKINVSVGKAERRTLVQERKILGTLEAYREADLGPLSAGRVKSLPVQIGDYVKVGQIVAKMDDAQLVATEAQYTSTKSQYDRSLSLFQSNAIPKSQFEGVEAQYTSLKRQLESLKENTVIVAPFNGIVTARACEEGELYSAPMSSAPGQSKGLIRVTQLNPLKLDLDIDNETIRYVKKGMQVRISVDQQSDAEPLFGRIEFVNPQANLASNTFSVRVVVENNKQLLRPGYFAEVHLVIDQKPDVLCVPKEALVDDRVFVVNGTIARSKKVTTGWITSDFAEILSGINENETVIIKGNKALPDSTEVIIGKE